MSLALRFSWRYFKNNLAINLLFVLTLIISSLGFLIINSMRTNLLAQVELKTKELSGGDIIISSRRRLQASELKRMTRLFNSHQYSQQMSFYSMVQGKDASKLVQIKGVDELFPLYGTIKLANGEFLSGRQLENLAGIYVYPELMDSLNLSVGDALTIGSLSLKVQGVVEEDVGQSMRGVNLAPRIYMPFSLLEKTGLIQFGSTISQVISIKLNNERDSQKLKTILEKVFNDPTIKIKSGSQAGQDQFRFLESTLSLLGLVGLFGIFLASLASLYSSFRMIHNLEDDFQSLKLMGIKRIFRIRILLGIQFFQMLISFTAIMALFFIIQQIDWGSGLVNELLKGLELRAVITLMVTFSLIIITGFFMAFAYQRKTPYFKIIGPLFLLALSGQIAFMQTNSIKMTIIFPIVLLGSSFVLYLLMTLFLRLASFLSWPIMAERWIDYLRRNKSLTFPFALCLGLGVVILNTNYILFRNMQEEIRFNPEKLPAYFLFDIQEEQRKELYALAHEKKINLEQLTPMVRGRLVKINGSELNREEESEDLTVEEEAEKRFRHRPVNLSFMDSLPTNESIVEGKWFTQKPQTPEISLEKRYAQRLGLRLGDRMEFDVQGVRVEGIVTSLRQVRWTSFTPSFFIVFSPGLLEDAPQTFLGVIRALDKNKASSFLRAMNNVLPNISYVDIQRLVKRITDILLKVVDAVEILSILILFSGLLVIVFIYALDKIIRREGEKLLLMIGLGLKRLNQLWFFQNYLLGIISIGSALFLSLGLSYLAVTELLQMTWNIDSLAIGKILGLNFFLGLAFLFPLCLIFRPRPLN